MQASDGRRPVRRSIRVLTIHFSGKNIIHSLYKPDMEIIHMSAEYTFAYHNTGSLRKKNLPHNDSAAAEKPRS